MTICTGEPRGPRVQETMERNPRDRYHAAVHTSHSFGAFRPKPIVRKPVHSQAEFHRPRTNSTNRDTGDLRYARNPGYNDAYPQASYRGPDDKSFSYSAHPVFRHDDDTADLLPSSQGVVDQHNTIDADHRTSIRGLVFQCCIHLLPILITSLLLVLNWRNIYWEDVDATKGQLTVLQSFQFPIKGHEILMVASTAAIVLHRVRYDMLIRKDLPLGFLTSPYRIGEILYLFSYEFRGAAFSNNSLRQLSMALLIIVGTIFSLVVGPSSGVLMIPKLNWWNVPHAFGIDTEMIYYNSTRSEKWPAILPSYACGAWGCPNDELRTLGTWAQNLGRQHVTPQVTFVGGSSLHRVVTSNSTTYSDGWTATTSLMMRDAEAISSFWNYIVQFNRAPAFLRRPRLTLKYVSGEEFLKPLVQVQCSAQREGTATEYPHSSLKGVNPGMYDGVKWPISSTVTSQIPRSDKPTFNFTSRLAGNGAPVLGGIFHVKRSEDQQSMIVPCSILTHWIPTTIWVDPKADMNSHDSMQNPLQAFETDTTKWLEFSISDEWLKQSGTKPLELVLEGMTLAREDSGMLRAGLEGMSWRLSTLLGLWLTDNIARYAPDAAVILHHEGAGTSSQTYLDIGILSYGPTEPQPPYSSWTQYFNERSLPKIAVEVDRYGYAWSFRGTLIKAAAGILVTHGLLALVHLFFMFHSRWTSTAWSSVGSIVAFTLWSDAGELVKAGSHLRGKPGQEARSKRGLWTIPVGAVGKEDADGSCKLNLVVSGEMGQVGNEHVGLDGHHGDVRLVSMR